MGSTAWPAVALAGLIAFGSAPARGQPADPATPPLVGFYAQRPLSAADESAREAIVRAAEARGAPFLDLTVAEPPQPEGRNHLARAVEAYHQVAYQDALRHADAGVAEAIATGARGLGPTELAELHLYRALAYTELGNAGRAWDDFVRAASIAPTRVLDPARFAPRVVETFRRAVEAVAPRPLVRATIGAPRDCGRWLDGGALADGDPTVPAGDHLLRLECPGHASWAARVSLTRDGQAIWPTLVRQLEPTTATLAHTAIDGGLGGAVLIRIRSVDRRRLLLVERVDARRRVLARASAIIGRDAAGATRAAFDRVFPDGSLVADTAAPAWYRRPLVWGALGAVVAAAIILPLALREDDRASGFDVEIGTTP